MRNIYNLNKIAHLFDDSKIISWCLVQMQITWRCTFIYNPRTLYIFVLIVLLSSVIQRREGATKKIAVCSLLFNPSRKKPTEKLKNSFLKKTACNNLFIYILINLNMNTIMVWLNLSWTIRPKFFIDTCRIICYRPHLFNIWLI